MPKKKKRFPAKPPPKKKPADDGSSSDGSEFSDGSSQGESGSDSQEDPGDYKKGGYHPVTVGDKFKDGRYMALQKLGWGHFSTVWLVWDTVDCRVAALKIQKSSARYSEAAQDEVEMLVHLNTHKGNSRHLESIVTLLDNFFHHGPHGKHTCMLFEVMGQSLLSLIKRYDYKGVPIPVVKKIAQDCTVGLDYMHRIGQLIHTDLKPENILMCLTPAEEQEMHVLGKKAYARVCAQLKTDAETRSADMPKSKKALKRQRLRERQLQEVEPQPATRHHPTDTYALAACQLSCPRPGSQFYLESARSSGRTSVWCRSR